jgi:ParB-like chromosome segregation protein Spo0J
MNVRPEIAALAKPITDFQPHPKNVRQGDVGAIAESLKAHGQYKPIVVQKSTNLVLTGNHTLQAARQLGWAEIAAVYVDCDDDQALRILLVDNRTNDLAMYDDRALAELLTELATSNSGLEGSLFTGDDLDDLLYRLEGTLGNASSAPALDEKAADYQAKDTRTLLLPFSTDDYVAIVGKLAALRKAYEVESNSDATMRAVSDAHAGLGD